MEIGKANGIVKRLPKAGIARAVFVGSGACQREKGSGPDFYADGRSIPTFRAVLDAFGGGPEIEAANKGTVLQFEQKAIAESR